MPPRTPRSRKLWRRSTPLSSSSLTGLLDTYQRLIFELADAELARVPVESAMAAVRYVVLGTVLIEPLLLAMRRMAQQEASERRYAR